MSSGLALREFLFIVAAPLSTLVGLAAFETWWSAAIFASAIAGGAYLAVRRHDKHHRSEAYDDRVSAERMDRARESLFKD